MLLDITAVEGLPAEDFIAAAGQPLVHPAQGLEILIDRLGDAVEIVPDARIRRVAGAGGVQIAFLDRTHQAVGEHIHVVRVAHGAMLGPIGGGVKHGWFWRKKGLI